jgi:hypothetical protein
MNLLLKNEHYTKDSTLMPEKLSIDLTLETVLDPERPPCITQTQCEKWADGTLLAL